VIERVSRHHAARFQRAHHRTEHALLFLALESRPRQSAQDAIGRFMPQFLQMLVETLGGIVDDMDARELQSQMAGKRSIDFHRQEKCRGGNFLLDRTREGAGPRTDFNHYFCLVQTDVRHHALSQPWGARHNRAGQRGGA